MNRTLLIISLLFLSFYCKGQELEVESFELKPKDLTARTQPRVDANGRKCAVIRIYVNDDLSAVRGSVIGDIMTTGLEKTIYLAHDTKKIELIFKKHLPLLMTFEDYDFPTITGSMTYVLKLRDKKDYYSDRPVPESKNQYSENTDKIHEEIKIAYKEGLYLKAMDLCKGIQDDSFAQFYIAKMYEQGKGVPQSYSEALSWYSKAAEQGLSEAQCNLGVLYNKGKNNEEAVKWFRKSADNGYAKGQCYLAVMYDIGLGVTQDFSEAVRWYRKAAEQNYTPAAVILGVKYENGQGIKQSYQEALKWYKFAADRGDMTAQSNLGSLYYHGKGVAQDFSLAAECFEKAAVQGHIGAQCFLGQMYEKGEGVPQNYKEAVKWYKMAADNGNENAQCFLGVLYEEGKGVERNYSEAAKLYKLAAEKGVALAQYNLGNLYKTGRGVPKDSSEAAKWLKKASFGR